METNVSATASELPATTPPRNGTPIVLVLLLTLSLITTVAAIGDGTLPGDVAVARWIQSAPEPLGAWIGWMGYWIGSAPLVVTSGALLTVILWRRGSSRLAAFALGILLLRALNPLLKTTIDSPRPPSDVVLVTEMAGGHGFPSGHAMGATLLFGGIIWLAERTIPNTTARRAVQAAALLLILITAVGRVATGAHWPSDVLGGVLWGVTGLAALAIAVERIGGASGELEAPHSRDMSGNTSVG